QLLVGNARVALQFGEDIQVVAVERAHGVGLVARKLPRILHLGLRVAQVTACRAIFATNGRAGRRTLAPTSKARNLQRSSPTRGTVAGDLSGRTAPGSARPTRPATGNGVTDTGSGAMKNSLGKPSGFPFFSSSFPELALPMPHRSRAVLWGRVYPGRRGWGRNRSREPDSAGRHKAGPTGEGCAALVADAAPEDRKSVV